MKKIKLPRKRKKAYKKSHPQNPYMMVIMLAEILQEEGRKYADRIYKLKQGKRGDKRFQPYDNGFVVVKRW